MDSTQDIFVGKGATAEAHLLLRMANRHGLVAGATGTLSERYASTNRDGAGWVRAKTGTLSQASGLTGFVVDTDGRVLTFALLSNDRSPGESRPALDAVAATLRGCGCR